MYKMARLGGGGHGTSALGLGLIKLCFLGVCVYKMARLGGGGAWYQCPWAGVNKALFPGSLCV